MVGLVGSLQQSLSAPPVPLSPPGPVGTIPHAATNAAANAAVAGRPLATEHHDGGWYIHPAVINQDICEHHFQHLREQGSHPNPDSTNCIAGTNQAWAARMQIDTAAGNTVSATSTQQPVNVLTTAAVKRIFPLYDKSNHS